MRFVANKTCFRSSKTLFGAYTAPLVANRTPAGDNHESFGTNLAVEVGTGQPLGVNRGLEGGNLTGIGLNQARRVATSKSIKTNP